MKRIISLFFVVLLPLSVGSQTTDAGSIKSIQEERREVLRFGIETEIIDLLSVLKGEKETALDEDILELFKSLPGQRLLKEIFDYFRVSKNPAAETKAHEFIDSFDGNRPELIITILEYLSEIKTSSPADKIYPLLDARDHRISAAAVKYLGRKGTDESADLLIDRFSRENTTTQDKGDIILALGELKSKSALPLLTKILDDEDEDLTLRRFACDALGKIGDLSALPSIKNALESKDNLLRAYGVYALGNFPGKETEESLISYLRDSFPRVRELAAQKLGELKTENAADILIFRARRDPEKRVKTASFRALSLIGGEKPISFLTGFLEDERNPTEFRLLAAGELIEKHPEAGSSAALKVMEQEWKKDNSQLLDGICKTLSQQEFSAFAPHYEKMLDHKSFIIQIYGIRGIQKNRLTGLKSRIEEFSKEKYHPQLRKHALAAMESL
jgi:HEAT repeat protein